MVLTEVELKKLLQEFTFRGKPVPAGLHQGITQYLSKGVIPGYFLRTIIMKDFQEAMMAADDENLWLIPAVWSFFYNNAPSLAWGSSEKMYEWSKFLTSCRTHA